MSKQQMRLEATNWWTLLPDEIKQTFSNIYCTNKVNEIADLNLIDDKDILTIYICEHNLLDTFIEAKS